MSTGEVTWALGAHPVGPNVSWSADAADGAWAIIVSVQQADRPEKMVDP